MKLLFKQWSALRRNLHHAYLRVREGDYSLSGLVGFELRTKTVGIIGTGAIGLAACQIFRARHPAAYICRLWAPCHLHDIIRP